MHLSLRLVLAFAVGLFTAGVLSAQAKQGKEKTPADLATEAFLKTLSERESPPPAPEVLATGTKLIKEYPGHRTMPDIIRRLASYGADTMKDTKGKSQAAQRTAWLSQLQYAVLREGGGDTPPPAQAALKALAAATAGVAVRQTPSRENLMDYRERIDRLAELPQGARFLVEQERGYIQLLRDMKNLAAAEKQATALLQHKDKKMQEMAQAELNLVLINKQPLELTFTALDGKSVDVAAMRGKPVFFIFWATTSEASVKELEAMDEAFASLPASKFQVIYVNCDKAEDRAAVEKAVKSNRLKQPVWFAGTGLENELGAKLNITKLPATALFDAKGMFVAVGTKAQAATAPLKRMIDAK